MTNATPSRLGVVNGATPANFAAETSLFLKVFAGEVLTVFEENNVMKDLHTMRTISSGKSLLTILSAHSIYQPNMSTRLLLRKGD